MTSDMVKTMTGDKVKSMTSDKFLVTMTSDKVKTMTGGKVKTMTGDKVLVTMKVVVNLPNPLAIGSELGNLDTDLKFVATVATGGRVKFLSAV